MLLSSGARRSRAQAQAGHAEHQRQGLRRAMRNFEALVGELEHGNRAAEGEEGFEGSEEPPTPNSLSSSAPQQLHLSQHYGDGKGVDRKTVYCWISLSVLALYFKLRADVGVPWLLILAPPWGGGIWYLFKASIPRMLASVEGALGAQHSMDRERISQMDFYRMQLGRRDWDQVERGCCACGLWGQAVIQTTLALSAAFYLGFVMMVALELDIHFIRPDSLWEILVPALLCLVFFLIASMTALCHILEGGSQMFVDSFDAKTWAYMVLLGTSGLISTAVFMKELGKIPPAMPHTNSSTPQPLIPEIQRAEGLRVQDLAFAFIPVAVVTSLPIPYLLWKGLRVDSSGARGPGFEMQTFSSEGSGYREGDGAGLLRVVDRPGGGGLCSKISCHTNSDLRNGVSLVLVLLAELLILQTLRTSGTKGPGIQGAEGPGIQGADGAEGLRGLSSSPFLDVSFLALMVALTIWANFGAPEVRRVERPPRRPRPQTPESPGSRGSGDRERTPQPLSPSTLQHHASLEARYPMETGLSQREAEQLVRERQFSRQIIVEEAGRLSQQAPPEALSPPNQQPPNPEEKDDEPSLKALLEERGITIPPEFLCSITLEIMKDPVILTDGMCYERRAIERWLSTHSTSPQTNQVVERDKLIPCHALRAMISEFVDSAMRGLEKADGDLEDDWGEGSGNKD